MSRELRVSNATLVQHCERC